MIEPVIASFEYYKRIYLPAGEPFRALVHVHAGMLVWVLALLILKRPARSLVPLAIVWALVLLGELADLMAFWPVTHSWFWRDTGMDIVQSVFWPSVLCLLARWSHAAAHRSQRDQPPAG